MGRRGGRSNAHPMAREWKPMHVKDVHSSGALAARLMRTTWAQGWGWHGVSVVCVRRAARRRGYLGVVLSVVMPLRA